MSDTEKGTLSVGECGSPLGVSDEASARARGSLATPGDKKVLVGEGLCSKEMTLKGWGM